MRTFVINELRETVQGEKFEVQTKMQFSDVNALVKHLRENPNLFWNGKYVISDEQRKIVTAKWGKNCG